MSDVLDALAIATNAQRRATTPDHSAWVEANAGTGKTKVLTDRVTRLLLDGVKPERILCLTFTKAAAAEMRNRLAHQLGRWALGDDAKLDDGIAKLIDRAPDRRRARGCTPPVRPRARCAGRHQHPDHPCLLPGAAEAFPARGRRRTGLRDSGRGRSPDHPAPRAGRADGSAGPLRCAAGAGCRLGVRRRQGLDRRIRRTDDEAAERAGLAARPHRRRGWSSKGPRTTGEGDGLRGRRYGREPDRQCLPGRGVRRGRARRGRPRACQGRQAGQGAQCRDGGMAGLDRPAGHADRLRRGLLHRQGRDPGAARDQGRDRRDARYRGCAAARSQAAGGGPRPHRRRGAGRAHACPAAARPRHHRSLHPRQAPPRRARLRRSDRGHAPPA